MMARRSDLNNGKWTHEELENVLSRASPYVRHFLWEVAQKPAIRSAEIKSPNAAAAILKRMANHAGKEPLLLRSEHSGEPTYSLNPNYRSWIADFVADASDLPAPRPKKRKPPVRRTNEKPSASPKRRVRTPKTPIDGSLTMPDGVDLEFCRELAEFLNSPPEASRYRIVLDEDQLLLEKV